MTADLTTARRFVVRRKEDPSGVSGTGVVLDGILWPDGTVSTHWRGAAWSNVFWPDLATAESKHCYGGHSEIVWVDELPAFLFTPPAAADEVLPPAPEVARPSELAERDATLPSPDAE